MVSTSPCRMLSLDLMHGGMKVCTPGVQGCEALMHLT